MQRGGSYLPVSIGCRLPRPDGVCAEEVLFCEFSVLPIDWAIIYYIVKIKAGYWRKLGR